MNKEVKCALSLPKLSNNILENIICINGEDYRLGNISADFSGNKGGNSWVYSLYDAQGEDIYDSPCYAIKINRFPIDDISKRGSQQNKRFDEEIQALKLCKSKQSKFILTIYEDGIISSSNGKGKCYKFYTMEYAENGDLKKYMENHPETSIYDRILICIKLTQALANLYNNGFYHRDIKPDNFFLTNDGDWKIGDLGLSMNRNKHNDLDGEHEFIGPRGWTTPEVMNKVLTSKTDRRYDRIIDDKSDIFQLGMVFWYVLQGNAPIGCIIENDFILDNHPLYELIRSMVSHHKLLRPSNFNDIIYRLNQIADNYLIGF